MENSFWAREETFSFRSPIAVEHENDLNLCAAAPPSREAWQSPSYLKTAQ